MTRLSVNLNKVALLRNARSLGIPSVTRAAKIAIDNGAHGITVHPRPDARHIRASDVHELAALIRGCGDIEFNIEGNPFEGLVDLVRVIRPHQCTLVPDAPHAATSDHGWDIGRYGIRLKPVIAELKVLGIRVSLFMDPIPEIMPAVHALGVDRIELYTEPYARAWSSGAAAAADPYAATARAAQRTGLGVNAGHDLNLHNLQDFLLAVPDVLEVSIGHALIADALETGLGQAVRNYLAAIVRATRPAEHSRQ
jgi:pyridoxine 5-phosphate synthase